MTSTTMPRSAPVEAPAFRLTVPRFLLLCVGHALLGVLLPHGSLWATAYAVGTTVVAVILAWRRPSTALYSALYIVGAEVLWRMTSADVFWEWGKYSAVATLVASLRGRTLRLSGVTWAALVYFLLLLPSVALTLNETSLPMVRERLSFSLSGPLTLSVAIVVAAQVPLQEFRPQRLIAFLLLPIIAIAARVGYGTLTADDLVFIAEANFTTSGGFGPNQVSSILGLGVLGLVFLAALTRDRLQQAMLYGLAAVIFYQGTLTFSRGGVVACLVGVSALVIHFSAQPKQAMRYFTVLVAFSLVLTLWVLPQADRWTGGMLSERFTTFDGSGRREIAEQDLELFLENPLLGVGPGLSPFKRSLDRMGVAAHTEFTRALAEHGVLGLASSLLLLSLAAVAYLRAPTVGTKAWIATFVCWGLANVLTASMRLGASAVIIALAFIDFSRLGSPARD